MATKKTTTKATEVKEVKVEAVVEAPKAEAKKAPAKKAATKATTTKTTTTKAATTKKAATKKETVITIQHQGNEVTVEANVTAAFVADGHKASEIKTLSIYVKPEEYAAYYVINDEFTGRVYLF